jgi:hypothetical protein
VALSHRHSGFAAAAVAVVAAILFGAAFSRPADARPVADPARAGSRGPVIGIGEQKPAMFTSRAWRALGLRHARYTAPWDALEDPHQRQLLDDWMAAARGAGVRVLLGFAHSLRSERMARVLPKPRRFARAFVGFRKRYPWVRDWLVWNEANHRGAPTAKRPRRAAQLFDAVVSHCRGCNVVAADVLDTPGMASWVARFRRHARHRPRIWGLHNYGDANGLKVKSTPLLLALTRGRIWFTETGGVVLRRVYEGKRVLQTFRYSLRHAARSTAHALALSCLSRRITRVYLYHWQPPPKVTNWDSGLVDRRGRPRPAYKALRRWLAGRRTRGGPCR